MSKPTESTYVWRRINRVKLPLIFDDDGDWVANPNIDAAASIWVYGEVGGEPHSGHIEKAERAVAAAFTPGDPDER